MSERAMLTELKELTEQNKTPPAEKQTDGSCEAEPTAGGFGTATNGAARIKGSSGGTGEVLNSVHTSSDEFKQGLPV